MGNYPSVCASCPFNILQFLIWRVAMESGILSPAAYGEMVEAYEMA